AGLVLPSFGAAAAEEATALEVNPAGIGFVHRLSLQYFHEGDGTPGSDADGVYATVRLGGGNLGYSQSWVRPGEGSRYRKQTWAVALGDGRALSLGIAWNRWSSPNEAVDDVKSWDLGLTVRPWRHLSIGAAARDLDARLAGAPLPIRWDVGLATRFLDDTFTVSADLLADDRGERFRPTHGAVGLLADLKRGLAAGVQVQFPVQDEPDIEQDVATLFSLTWNDAHAGWTGGALALPSETGWIAGVRLSGERYRSARPGTQAPSIDVEEILTPRRTFFLALSDADPFGTLVRKLEEARDDPAVAVVVLRLEGLPISWGRAEELRALVQGIRREKPVLAYLAGGGMPEYYLATAADAIAAPPSTTLFVNGLATSNLYLRDGLARLGVAFEVVRVGGYKTAPEPLTRTEPSPESREVANAILDDVFGRVVREIGTARKLPEERVRALVDEGLFTGEEAHAAGLVDAVVWPDELEEWVRAGVRRRVRLTEGYDPAPTRVAQRWGPRDTIALILVEGAIVNGRSRRSPFGGDAFAGSDTIAKQIREAADDRDVRAIVVRVDSPGGDGFASDLIWRELVRAREKGKPVVASMGDVAASGGYLVAAAADAIVAEPSTLTGSIGVFALKPDVSSLLGKLSIRREGFSRGEIANLFAVTKPWTDAERKAVESQVSAFYRQFVARVAEGRRLSTEEVEAVAGGRVWTGAQAVERRLVDRIGTLS
ncbi:MAG TPA: signal peptide peptidase SppA, partial [Anaeromyxobacteraceae bacterium]|nr:signal peptide peptidase SppA [Anaeromyxobacteraceae bacterium]